MQPLGLYLENFTCYKTTYINLREISSAIIIGKLNNNDHFSNAVGKSSIFKSIEYVLFNYFEDGLEKIVRDEAEKCNVVFDFSIDGIEYRVSRSRTKKGISDLTLYKKINENPVYHTVVNDEIIPSFSDKDWKDISGRRASDTEKDLEKITKINIKLFRIFVHFVQNDFSGLTSATPQKRKGILKDALDLSIYPKLEKLAKDKANELQKEIDRNNTLLNSLVENRFVDADMAPQKISLLSQKIVSDNNSLLLINNQIDEMKSNILLLNSQIQSSDKDYVELQKSFTAQKQEIEVLKNSLTSFSNKKTSSISDAKKIISDVKGITSSIKSLEENNFDQITELSNDLDKIKSKTITLNVEVSSLLELNKELLLPLPDENYCKHCRQKMSEEHKEACRKQVAEQVASNKNILSNKRQQILVLEANAKEINAKLIKMSEDKKRLDALKNNLISKSKELETKKSMHNEFSIMVAKFENEIKQKEIILSDVKEKLNKASRDEVEKLNIEVAKLNTSLKEELKKYSELQNSIQIESKNKYSLELNLENEIKNREKIKKIQDELKKVEEDYKIYPDIIKGFSSSGIPNFIINNILGDLQEEANNLLEKLKPGLQLSFLLEKTTSKDEVKDTLDIIYNINGRQRGFSQLSGAQQFVVNFSLKLALSFLLQKMSGVNIKFLLLDEVDQSLDKAGVDAFSEIVKTFQEDYKIIVITHNDRLKDKFKDKIIVNQNLDLISRATLERS